MAISQIAADDDILARIKTIQGLDVYEGAYITDGAIPKMDSMQLFPPYATVIFGASYAGADRGIASERYNTLRTTVTVYVVAPTDRLARVYQDNVRDKLIGFEPTDSTPLRQSGGYDFADADLGATRYVHASVFDYTTNMSPF